MNIILIAAVSADGKIAQHEGQTSLDWTCKEDTQFFVSKTKEVGVVIMGRKTFETIGKPLKGRRMIVMSRGSEVAAGFSLRKNSEGREMGTIEFTNDSPKELLFRLTQEGCESVVIAGGASIYSAFLKDGLVDELFLTVEPVLFGSGVPLGFEFDRVNLRLLEVTRLGDQAVLLHYRI